MKRKVLSVMLCAAMVVSMTACGGSDAKENTASANASVSETEQGEATEQDAQEEANEILRLASAFFAQAELDRRFKS